MTALTPEQLAVYRAHYRATREQAARERVTRHQLGWERARAAAQILKEEFGVETVYLFGSLLDVEAVHPASDIDLAVVGLSTRRYCEVLGELLCRTRDFSVDLVRLEEAQASLAEHILACGVAL